MVALALEAPSITEIGWAIAVALLAFENTLVQADNLSKLHSPFFKYNSVISMLLLLFTTLAVVL